MNKLKLGIVIVFLLSFACQKKPDSILSLIPKPQSITQLRGQLNVEGELTVSFHNQISDSITLYARLSQILNQHADNITLISVVQDADVVFNYNSNLPDEGYTLDITKKGIDISSSSTSGIQNALSTLDQLLTANSSPSISLPRLSIEDAPRFAWRGLMLDCSRTFIPLEELYRYVDRLAYYKLNVLHLHLTDDQGWRFEIKAYPELTEKCAQFSPRYTNQNGGYYTQVEMKELIEYALERNVTIVPEIEMPGHSSEVFAAFPSLSCRGEKTEIFPFFSGPGITADIFCAGKESVFQFIETVLDEVCQVFPSPYIHIGGDEAPKIRWDNCEQCQNRMQIEKLSDTHELQSYFIQRVEKMLTKRSKKLIGWDEILEGGLADNAAVMSWRGVSGGIAAAKSGHHVVMSPTSHCYFDYSYGTTSVEEVYGFDPIPAELDSSDYHYVMGGQANFWTHIDRQLYAMQRQIFPRITALAEVLWSGPGGDYNLFEQRLNDHYNWLDSTHVNYYHPSKIIEPKDTADAAAKLNLEGYAFDFHGFQGASFNYQGMDCKIVLPNEMSEGKEWVWRARFWGHEPQFDLALLEKGYHLVYCDVGNLYGNPEAVRRWNQFYALMQRAGLAQRCILEGMSRGGLIIYNWAVANPDKVAGIYADAPVLNGFSWPGGFGQGKGSRSDWERFKRAYQINSQADSLKFAGDPIRQAEKIAKLGIPMIHVCGEADQVVPMGENTNRFAEAIKRHGGKIKVIRKPGVGHHPHSLENPDVLIDYLLKHKSENKSKSKSKSK